VAPKPVEKKSVAAKTKLAQNKNQDCQNLREIWWATPKPVEKKSAAAKTKLAQNENQECQNLRQQKNPQAARASVTKIENQILTCHADTRTECV
jgi:hypothetical protein